MAAFGKTARGVMVGALIIAPVFVSTIAAAKTVNFESLEVEESQGQAVMAIDIPPGGVVEPEQFANRHELVLTFHGVPTTTARRIHAGSEPSLFQSVDIEPWYEDGEQQTRMVVHYAPNSQVSYSREGDILVVTLFDTGEESSAEWAATPDVIVTSDAYLDAAPAETAIWTSDDVADSEPAVSSVAVEAPETSTPMVSASADAATAAVADFDGGTSPAMPVARYEWDTEATDAYADDAYGADTYATAADEPAATLWTVDEAVTDSNAYMASGYTYDEATGTYSYVGTDDSVTAGAEMPAPEPVDIAEAAPETPAERVADGATRTAVAYAADDAVEVAVAEVTSMDDEVATPMERREATPDDAVMPWVAASDTWNAEEQSWENVNERAWEGSETMTAARSHDDSLTPVVAGLSAPVMVGRQDSYPADTQPTVISTSGRNLDDPPLISLDVQGADIHTVLRSIAESADANIVANSDVRGKVTLKLDDVPWRRALGIVLLTQSLGHVEDLGIIRVAGEQTLRQEDIERQTAQKKKEELIALETAVVPVSFASAPELAQALAGRLSQRGALDVDARTNSLIVTDVPHNIPVLTDLVQLLDTRTPQVEIVAKLVDLDMSAVRDLGVNWFVGNVHSTSEALSASGGVDANIASPVGSVNFGVIRDFADLDLTLQALETDQRANIISTPKITTVNNRQARVLVGQEIPLITLDEAGNAITELKKIGIELKVTPYINQGDMITLDLHPMVSDLAAQSTQQGGVIINTSEADTRVMVRNGETAVIGGLIRTNTTSFSREVPVLGKIPILGALFRTSTDTDNKRELVIFVTPRTIR